MISTLLEHVFFLPSDFDINFDKETVILSQTVSKSGAKF